YSICFSNGKIWALDWKTQMWSVVQVRNLREFGSVESLVRDKCVSVEVQSITNHASVSQTKSVPTGKLDINYQQLVEATALFDRRQVSEAHEEPKYTCKICLSDDIARPLSIMIPCGHAACTECIQKL
ncbi:hypothetical protein PENTCL1PPCAC_1608, partial [Pristionchus entomophagus]